MGAETILLTLSEMAVKPGCVCPALNTLAVVEVVLPVTNVSLLAVVGLEGTESVCLVVLPVAFISVTVWTPELTFAICLVIEPLALIFGVIGPKLDTVCNFSALLIHIPCEECSLHHFDILNVLEVELVNHLLQFGNLLLRTAIVLLLVSGGFGL